MMNNILDEMLKNLDNWTGEGKKTDIYKILNDNDICYYSTYDIYHPDDVTTFDIDWLDKDVLIKALKKEKHGQVEIFEDYIEYTDNYSETVYTFYIEELEKTEEYKNDTEYWNRLVIESRYW